MDAHRTALDVPVDHHPAPAVAGVPLGHQVLVEGAEVLAVRSAGSHALTPDPGVTRGERRVDHTPGRIAQGVGVDITASRVQQLFVAEAVPADGEALQPSIGTQSIQTQQQPAPNLAAVAGQAVGASSLPCAAGRSASPYATWPASTASSDTSATCWATSSAI